MNNSIFKTRDKKSRYNFIDNENIILVDTKIQKNIHDNDYLKINFSEISSVCNNRVNIIRSFYTGKNATLMKKIKNKIRMRKKYTDENIKEKVNIICYVNKITSILGLLKCMKDFIYISGQYRNPNNIYINKIFFTCDELEINWKISHKKTIKYANKVLKQLIEFNSKEDEKLILILDKTLSFYFDFINKS